METKVELAKAILCVMKEVEGVEKTLTVGTGQSAYSGVSDQEVKKIIGKAMANNGLTILPINIEPNVNVERWEQVNGNYKQMKQQVFTEVKVTYLLMHESGQSMEIVGYGHGVDSQDKSAGKATTYALKYALLYTFLVPTGKIDDADNHESEESKQPVKKQEVIIKKAKLDDERFNNAIEKIKEGKYSIEALEVSFELNQNQSKILEDYKQKIESDEK